MNTVERIYLETIERNWMSDSISLVAMEKNATPDEKQDLDVIYWALNAARIATRQLIGRAKLRQHEQDQMDDCTEQAMRDVQDTGRTCEVCGEDILQSQTWIHEPRAGSVHKDCWEREHDGAKNVSLSALPPSGDEQ